MTQDDAYGELFRLSGEPEDPRSDRGKRHELAELLFLTVVVLLCGAQNADEIAHVSARM